jgi:hypothetical protein
MAENLAPAPEFPERVGATYERKLSPAMPGLRGPLRFEEGVATASQGYETQPGRPNHNVNVMEKFPEETMRERAHVGSAAWVEAPTYLGEYAQGAFANAAEARIEEVVRSGARYQRMNPATVMD